MFAIVTTANSARMPTTTNTIRLCTRATSVEPAMLSTVIATTSADREQPSPRRVVVGERVARVAAERDTATIAVTMPVRRIGQPGGDGRDVADAEALVDVLQQAAAPTGSGAELARRSSPGAPR